MKSPRPLGLFAILMLNLVITASIKNWPMVAGFGFSSIFYFFLAFLLFLVPCTFVVAELTSTWSGEGGLYLWVKEAFGHSSAFTVTWLLFFDTLLWLPLPLTVVATSLRELFHIADVHKTIFEMATVLLLLWGTTLLAFLGIKWSTLLTVICGVLGLLVPGVLILALGVMWIISGQHVQVSFSLNAFLSEITSINNWVIFSSLIYALTGLEAMAFLQDKVKQPKKNFPRAAFISLGATSVLVLFGSLAISVVLPREKITLFVGTYAALNKFLIAYNLKGLYAVGGVLITIGIFASMNIWLILPMRGMYFVAKNGDLPSIFHKTNRFGAPLFILLIQAFIVSLICILILLFPNINEQWWIFLSLGAILYLLVYLFFFAAAIKLRYKHPDIHRPFKIPGEKKGMWIVAGTGFCTSFVLLCVSFLLPNYILNFDKMDYFPWFTLGLVLIVLFPHLILRFKKESWKKEPFKNDTESQTSD